MKKILKSVLAVCILGSIVGSVMACKEDTTDEASLLCLVCQDSEPICEGDDVGGVTVTKLYLEQTYQALEFGSGGNSGCRLQNQ